FQVRGGTGTYLDRDHSLSPYRVGAACLGTTTLSVCPTSPPLPGTRGRGVGGEGAYPRQTQDPSPQPLSPEYRGEGLPGETLTPSRWSPGFSRSEPRPAKAGTPTGHRPRVRGSGGTRDDPEAEDGERVALGVEAGLEDGRPAGGDVGEGDRPGPGHQLAVEQEADLERCRHLPGVKAVGVAVGPVEYPDVWPGLRDRRLDQLQLQRDVR